MKTVTLVMVLSGQHDDETETPIRAFTYRRVAEAFAEAANGWLRERGCDWNPNRTIEFGLCARASSAWPFGGKVSISSSTGAAVYTKTIPLD